MHSLRVLLSQGPCLKQVQLEGLFVDQGQMLFFYIPHMPFVQLLLPVLESLPFIFQNWLLLEQPLCKWNASVLRNWSCSLKMSSLVMSYSFSLAELHTFHLQTVQYYFVFARPVSNGGYRKFALVWRRNRAQLQWTIPHMFVNSS